MPYKDPNKRKLYIKLWTRRKRESPEIKLREALYTAFWREANPKKAKILDKKQNKKRRLRYLNDPVFRKKCDDRDKKYYKTEYFNLRNNKERWVKALSKNKKRMKLRGQKQRDSLHPTYLRKLLREKNKINLKIIPESLIKLKQKQLKLKRYVKQHNKLQSS